MALQYSGRPRISAGPNQRSRGHDTATGPSPDMSEGAAMDGWMSEARAEVPGGIPLDLDAIAAVAWTLEPPTSSERRGLLRGESAKLVEGLFTRCGRGRGALDIAIGEGLLALGTGDRVLRLGFSGIGDYARERLGIAASTAQKMARLARELRGRLLLRDAVWTGEVTVRQAETILPVARGEAEEVWVARARSGETVRRLKAAVKAATGSEHDEDEAWERVMQMLGLWREAGFASFGHCCRERVGM